MSERTVRVGELLLRELSTILHSRWRSESVGITLTYVDAAPDLRKATVYYSAIGARKEAAEAGRFLMKNRNELKALMMKKIVLKYTPDLEFVYDHSFERGSRVLDILEEIEREENSESENLTKENSDGESENIKS